MAINNKSRVSVTTATAATFTLHQQDKKSHHAFPYIDIGLTILKQSKTDSTKYEYVSCCGWCPDRQVSCEVPVLEVGETYIVVPTTTGIKFRQQDDSKPPADFSTALFDSSSPSHLSDVGCKVIDELFERYNADMDGYLSDNELRAYLHDTQGNLSESEVRVYFTTTVCLMIS